MNYSNFESLVDSFWLFTKDVQGCINFREALGHWRLEAEEKNNEQRIDLIDEWLSKALIKQERLMKDPVNMQAICQAEEMAALHSQHEKIIKELKEGKK